MQRIKFEFCIFLQDSKHKCCEVLIMISNFQSCCFGAEQIPCRFSWAYPCTLTLKPALWQVHSFLDCSFLSELFALCFGSFLIELESCENSFGFLFVLYGSNLLEFMIYYCYFLIYYFLSCFCASWVT